MQPSVKQPLPPTSITRALQLLQSALASCATVETTDDPTVIEIRPGTMAGPPAIVTRIRLQAAKPMPAALQPNVTSIPIIIVGQRLSVRRAAIRDGRAHSVVGCIDNAGIVTIRLPGVCIDRTDVKAKPIKETQTPSVGTMTDSFADRSSSCVENSWPPMRQTQDGTPANSRASPRWPSATSLRY